jgi:dihydrofolate reductase
VHYPAYAAEEWVETAREPHEAYDRVFLDRHPTTNG